MFRWCIFSFISALISTFTSNLHFGGADFHKAGPERRKGSKQPALDIWTEGDWSARSMARTTEVKIYAILLYDIN